MAQDIFTKLANDLPFGASPAAAEAGTNDPAAAIRRVAQERGISADNLLGLAQLETRGGKATIRGGEVDTRNLFNIKDFSKAGTGIRALDKAEGSRDRYRQYGSYDESVVDLVDLLSRKYPGALTAKTPEDFAAELKRGGYATDPDYVRKLASTIKSVQGKDGAPTQAPVEQWDQGARYVPMEQLLPGGPPARNPNKNPGFFRGAGDVGLSFLQGAAGSVKSVTDLAGAGNAVSRGLDDVSKGLGQLKSEEAQQSLAYHQKKIKDAETNGDWKQEVGAYADMVWDMPGDSLAQALGSLITLGAGKTAQALKLALSARKAGMTKEAFLKTAQGVEAAKKASNLGAGVNLGLGVGQGVGGVKGEQYERTYNAAKEEGLADNEAQALATEAQSYGKGWMQQAAGAALGYAAAKTGPLEKLASGQTVGAGGVLRRLAGGAGIEGVSEGTQGAQARYAGNTAAIDAGVLDESQRFAGVAGTAFSEGLLGGVVGGGAGALGRPDVDPLATTKEAAKKPNSPISRAAVAGQPAEQNSEESAADPFFKGMSDETLLLIQRHLQARQAAGDEDIDDDDTEMAQAAKAEYERRMASTPPAAPDPKHAPAAQQPTNTAAPAQPAGVFVSGGAQPAAQADPAKESAPPAGTYMPGAEINANRAKEQPKVVLQNRDRSGAASVQQMIGIASNPDFLRVGPSTEMTTGAPVVFGDLPPTAVKGRPETVVDGKGDRIQAQYVVVDAGDLIASNNADGTPVDDYVNGLPGKLRAVAGNGRTAGIQKAYQQGTAEKYRQDLIENAQTMGLDAATIEAMQQPVLVRVMDAADVRDDMGDRTNITGTQRLSAVEQAANDARRLNLAELAFDENGNPTQETLRRFINGMPDSEKGDQLAGKAGTPTRQAVDRLMAATFKQAYNSDELVELYAQTPEPEARAILNAAAEAAGALSALKEMNPDFDVREAVAGAVKMAVNAARQQKPLAEFAQNTDLDTDPDAFAVARFLGQYANKPRQMANGLREWARDVLGQAEVDRLNQSQGGLFGAKPTLTREQLFARLGNIDPNDEATIQAREALAKRDTEKSASQKQVAQAPVKTGAAEEVADGLRPEDVVEATDGFGLEAQTPEQLQAQADERAAEDKRQRDAEQAAEAKAQADDERNRIAQASVQAADTFERGQNALDNLTGQTDLLAQMPAAQVERPASAAAQPTAKSNNGLPRTEVEINQLEQAIASIKKSEQANLSQNQQTPVLQQMQDIREKLNSIYATRSAKEIQDMIDDGETSEVDLQYAREKLNSSVELQDKIVKDHRIQGKVNNYIKLQRQFEDATGGPRKKDVNEQLRLLKESDAATQELVDMGYTQSQLGAILSGAVSAEDFDRQVKDGYYHREYGALDSFFAKKDKQPAAQPQENQPTTFKKPSEVPPKPGVYQMRDGTFARFDHGIWWRSQPTAKEALLTEFSGEDQMSPENRYSPELAWAPYAAITGRDAFGEASAMRKIPAKPADEISLDQLRVAGTEWEKMGDAQRKEIAQASGLSDTVKPRASQQVWSNFTPEMQQHLYRSMSKLQSQSPVAAAAQPQDGDILSDNGKPFAFEYAAKLRAKKEGGEVVQVAGGYVVRPTQGEATQADPVVGNKIDDEWTAFSEQSGTLGIPRAEMPQVKAQDRGAMVNFLKARGIDSSNEVMPSRAIKPTQAEFSPAKVQEAAARTDGDRSIIVSADGYVVDGHHQWMAQRQKGESVNVIRLDQPIGQVLEALKDMPSAQPEQATTSGEHSTSAMPAFERYNDALDWVKERAKAQGLSVMAYGSTGEYKNDVLPQLETLYATYKAKWDADTAEAGKAMQQAMAKDGIRAGDVVEWNQPGAFLSTEKRTGTVKIDRNGVPHVHMDSEMAVSRAGRVGYTKKLRWQPYMQKAGANVAQPEAATSGERSTKKEQLTPADTQAQPQIAALDATPVNDGKTQAQKMPKNRAEYVAEVRRQLGDLQPGDDIENDMGDKWTVDVVMRNGAGEITGFLPRESNPETGELEVMSLDMAGSILLPTPYLDADGNRKMSAAGRVNRAKPADATPVNEDNKPAAPRQPTIDTSPTAKWRDNWGEARRTAESLGLPIKDGKRNLKLTEMVPAIEAKLAQQDDAPLDVQAAIQGAVSVDKLSREDFDKVAGIFGIGGSRKPQPNTAPDQNAKNYAWIEKETGYAPMRPNGKPYILKTGIGKNEPIATSFGAKPSINDKARYFATEEDAANWARENGYAVGSNPYAKNTGQPSASLARAEAELADWKARRNLPANAGNVADVDKEINRLEQTVAALKQVEYGNTQAAAIERVNAGNSQYINTRTGKPQELTEAQQQAIEQAYKVAASGRASVDSIFEMDGQIYLVAERNGKKKAALLPKEGMPKPAADILLGHGYAARRNALITRQEYEARQASDAKLKAEADKAAAEQDTPKVYRVTENGSHHGEYYVQRNKEWYRDVNGKLHAIGNRKGDNALLGLLDGAQTSDKMEFVGNYTGPGYATDLAGVKQSEQGSQAFADGKPRTPPEGLSVNEMKRWLSGWDAGNLAASEAQAVAQPITRADLKAAQQQATAIIGARIDAMSAGEVNAIAKKFLPTMGMKPTMSKANNKAAMTDPKINLEAAADEVGATLPAEVTRALQAEMEGRAVDATTVGDTQADDGADKLSIRDAAAYLKDFAYSLSNLPGVTDAVQMEIMDHFGKSGRDALLMKSHGVSRADAHEINNSLDARKPYKLRAEDMEDAFAIFPGLRAIIDDGIKAVRAREDARQAKTATQAQTENPTPADTNPALSTYTPVAPTDTAQESKANQAIAADAFGPAPVENYRVAKQSGNSVKVYAPVGKSFTEQEIKSIVEWIRAAGWSAYIEGKSIRAISPGLAGTWRNFPESSYLKKSAKHAIEKWEKAEANKAEAAQQVQALPAYGFVENLLGSAANQYNKSALAKFLDGKANTYDGLVGYEWKVVLKAAGINVENDSNQGFADAIKAAYLRAQPPVLTTYTPAEIETQQSQQAQANPEPNPLDYTPKQYADAWLRWSAETNGLPLAEVREMQGDEAGLKAIEQRWVDAVAQEAKNGQPIPAKTLDKLLEVRPNTQLPESAIPDGYQRPEARKAEKEEAAARKGTPTNLQEGIENGFERQVRYSRNARTATGLPTAQAQAVVRDLQSSWANAPAVVVVQDLQDPRVPQSVREVNARQVAAGAAGAPDGFIHGETVYLVASQMRSPADAARVLLHEVVGHYGLRGVFGENLSPILRDLASKRRRDVVEMAVRYGLVPDGTATDASVSDIYQAMTPAQREQAAEEVLAYMAQYQPELGFVQRAIAAIRQWLKSTFPMLGERLALLDSDIVANYITPARAFVEGGRPRVQAHRTAKAQSNLMDVLAALDESGVVDINC